MKRERRQTKDSHFEFSRRDSEAASVPAVNDADVDGCGWRRWRSVDDDDNADVDKENDDNDINDDDDNDGEGEARRRKKDERSTRLKAPKEGTKKERKEKTNRRYKTILKKWNVHCNHPTKPTIVNPRATIYRYGTIVIN